MRLLIFLLAGLFVVLIVRSTGISINSGGYAGSKGCWEVQTVTDDTFSPLENEQLPDFKAVTSMKKIYIF